MISPGELFCEENDPESAYRGRFQSCNAMSILVFAWPVALLPNRQPITSIGERTWLFLILSGLATDSRGAAVNHQTAGPDNALA